MIHQRTGEGDPLRLPTREFPGATILQADQVQALEPGARLDDGGRPAEHYLDAQRAAHLQRMRELTGRRRTADVIDALLADHGLFHLEADLRWIDLTVARLDQLAEAVRS